MVRFFFAFVLLALPLSTSAVSEEASQRSESRDSSRMDRLKGLFSRIFNRRRDRSEPKEQAVESREPAPEPTTSRSDTQQSLRQEARRVRQESRLQTPRFDLKSFEEDAFADVVPLEESNSVRRVRETQESPQPDPVKTTESTIQPGQDVVHTVKPGESLRLIARQYYQDPAEYVRIREWNRLSSNVLQVGQKLTLKKIRQAPDFSEAVSAAESEKPRNSRSLSSVPPEELFPSDAYRFTIYKVESGDTLSGIASAQMGSSSYASDLGRFNDLATNSYLYVGQTLVVPIRK